MSLRPLQNVVRARRFKTIYFFLKNNFLNVTPLTFIDWPGWTSACAYLIRMKLDKANRFSSFSPQFIIKTWQIAISSVINAFHSWNAEKLEISKHFCLGTFQRQGICFSKWRGYVGPSCLGSRVFSLGWFLRPQASVTHLPCTTPLLPPHGLRIIPLPQGHEKNWKKQRSQLSV